MIRTRNITVAGVLATAIGAFSTGCKYDHYQDPFPDMWPVYEAPIEYAPSVSGGQNPYSSDPVKFIEEAAKRYEEDKKKKQEEVEYPDTETVRNIIEKVQKDWSPELEKIREQQKENERELETVKKRIRELIPGEDLFVSRVSKGIIDELKRHDGNLVSSNVRVTVMAIPYDLADNQDKRKAIEPILREIEKKGFKVSIQWPECDSGTRVDEDGAIVVEIPQELVQRSLSKISN